MSYDEDYAARQQRLQEEREREWERKEKEHQAHHASVREMQQYWSTLEYWNKKWERQNKRWSHGRETNGRTHFDHTPFRPYQSGSTSDGILGSITSWRCLLERVVATILFILVLPVFIVVLILAMQYVDSRKNPTAFQSSPKAAYGKASPPQAPACNAGNYPPDAGTLHLFAPEINRETREIVLNGVDTARPTTPFRFNWGDGTVTVGWFPQLKIYKRRPHTTGITCYEVRVVATHNDGLTAEAGIAVNP